MNVRLLRPLFPVVSALLGLSLLHCGGGDSHSSFVDAGIFYTGNRIDSGAGSGSDSDDDNPTGEECATPCTPSLAYGGYSWVGTCAERTVCHYRCPNGVTVTSASDHRTTPSIEALCGDAGLDAGSDSCTAFLAKCESGN